MIWNGTIKKMKWVPLNIARKFYELPKVKSIEMIVTKVDLIRKTITIAFPKS